MTIYNETYNVYYDFYLDNGGFLLVSFDEGRPEKAYENGQDNGVAVMTTPENFHRDVRNWYEAHIKPDLLIA